MNFPILLMLLVGLFDLMGQIAIKRGIDRLPARDPVGFGEKLAFVRMVLTNPMVLGGIGLLALWYLLYLTVLARFDVSQAFPIQSINVVLLMLFSRLILGERIPPMRWFGGILIGCGVMLVVAS